MDEIRNDDLKKQQGLGGEGPEKEAPRTDVFSMDDSQDEKKDLLGREEIRTMKKDMSAIREEEAQREKERLISLKVVKDQEASSPFSQKEDEAKKAEELKKEQERRLKEAEKEKEMRRIREVKKIEEAKRVEEARKAAEARRAEEARKMEEARKAWGAERLAAMKKAEEAKRAEEARKIEEIRRVEEIRRARETERLAAMKKAEEMKKIEEARKMEELRMAAEAEALQEIKSSEETKIMEETRKTRELELSEEVKEAQEMVKAREAAKIKEREMEKEKELEELMREGEEVAVQSQEIFQEISSFKPEGSQFFSYFKKVLIRFAIVGVIIALEILAGFLYWYLTILPMEKGLPELPKVVETKKTTIIIPSPLISVQTTITIEASSSEEAAMLLPQYFEKKPETGGFARILIKNRRENRIFELNDFLSAFKISPPAGLLEKLESGFTLFVHADKESGRFGFIAKIKENEQKNLSDIMTSWEPKMEKDFENIFASLGKNQATKNIYFRKATYKGAVFRYISFPPYKNFGICWSTFNNYLLWTDSGESMMRVIDALSE